MPAPNAVSLEEGIKAERDEMMRIEQKIKILVEDLMMHARAQGRLMQMLSQQENKKHES